VGALDVALYVNVEFCAAALKHTGAAVAGVVIVGRGLIVRVKTFPVLMQPLPLLTLSVPVYVPAATPAVIGNVMGLTGSAVVSTSKSPAMCAAPFQVMV